MSPAQRIHNLVAPPEVIEEEKIADDIGVGDTACQAAVDGAKKSRMREVF